MFGDLDPTDAFFRKDGDVESSDEPRYRSGLDADEDYEIGLADFSSFRDVFGS